MLRNTVLIPYTKREGCILFVIPVSRLIRSRFPSRSTKVRKLLLWEKESGKNSLAISSKSGDDTFKEIQCENVNLVGRQFHPHYTYSFFVRKCFEKVLSAYSLCLQFFWLKEIGAKAACKNVGEIDYRMTFPFLSEYSNYREEKKNHLFRSWKLISHLLCLYKMIK